MLPLDTPPEGGSIQLRVPLAPVSFQAPASKKAEIVSALRALVSPCGYVLTGDVTVEIRWHISARARYESNGSADVDNIVKPILDALCGPEGIMVDDCQVQALTCYWTGGMLLPAGEEVEIEIGFETDAYFVKRGLTFLHIENGLYFPMSVGEDTSLSYANVVIGRYAEYRHLLAQGIEPRAAMSLLPIQRVFHKSKVDRFPLVTLEDLREPPA